MKKKSDIKNEKEITMDLPEVKDIPGQEHIHPPKMREMMDSTPSSSSDEGEGILDDVNEEDDEVVNDDSTNVTAQERELLRKAERTANDETADLEKLALDKTDDEDELNEKSDPLDMGEDLDVPGSEDDDDNEEIGEEDEENNSYSRKD